MATVYGLHEVELRPEVDPEDYEERFADAVADHELMAGWKAYLLRGDRGGRAGRYLVVYEMESEEARDRYFGPDAAGTEELERFLAEHAEGAAAWQRVRSCEAAEVTTDYVVVAP